MRIIYLWLVLAGVFFVSATLNINNFVQAKEVPIGVPVLLYHKIVNSKAELSPVCCTILRSEFEKQLDYLNLNGYHTINSDQLYNYLTKGTKLPPKPVMLSFDDFHPSDYEVALPLLLRNKFTGVFFIPTNYTLESPDRLAGLQVLARNNMDIESHTIHHYFLTRQGKTSYDQPILTIKPKIAKEEIVNSKLWLEKTLGKKAEYLAWPGGAFNEELVYWAKKAGYKGLFLAKSSWPPYLKTGRKQEKIFFNVYGLDNPGYIKRINVDSYLSFSNWQYILEKGNLHFPPTKS